MNSHLRRFFVCLVLTTMVFAQAFGITKTLAPDVPTKEEVTNNGSMNYSVPIEVPQGTNGMTPSWGLSYNSFSDDGLMGPGWTISGMSAISRDPSFPVAMNDNIDQFLWDGQKLILVETQPTYKVYRTEKETFTRIRAYNLWTNTSYWQVLTKDGRIMTYGVDPGSTASTYDGWIDSVSSSGLPRLWALRKVQDAQGNFYRIDYFKDTVNGDYYPAKILYSLNNANPLSQANLVRFNYITRSDHAAKYLPTKVDQDQLLSSVDVVVGTDLGGAGGNLLRQYAISYQVDSSTSKNYVSQIQEKGSSGTSVLWTQSFTWQSNNPATGTNYTFLATELGYTTLDESNGEQPARHFIDMNADGITDYVRLMGNPGAYFYKVTLGTLQGTGSSYTFIDQGAQDIIGDTCLGGNAKLSARYWIDMNGDGFVDYLRWATNQYLVTLGSSSGHGQTYTFVAQSEIPDLGYEELPDTNDLAAREFMDMNADGYIDMVYLVLVNGVATYKVLPGAQMGHGTPYVLINHDLGMAYLPDDDSLTDNNTSPGRRFIDMNGDSYPDFVRIFARTDTSPWYWNYKVTTFSNLGEGSSYDFVVKPYIDNSWTKSVGRAHQWMDFNGDGMVDLVRTIEVQIGQENFQPAYELTTGSFLGSSGSTSLLDYPVSASAEVQFIDVNGDRYVDFLRRYSDSGTPPFSYQVRLGTYSGIPATNTTYVFISEAANYNLGLDSLPQTQGRQPGRQWTDMNGDGLLDFLRYTSDGNYQIMPGTGLVKQRAIASITTATGAIIEVTYTPASQVSGAILGLPNSSQIIPNTWSRNLVTKIEVNPGNGIGTILTTKYNYYNGQTYNGPKPDRTDLGFQWISATPLTSTNPEAGPMTKTWFNQTLEKAGQASLEQTYGVTGKLYLATTYSYDNTTFPQLLTATASYNYNGEGGTDGSTTTPRITGSTYSYDASGNQTLATSLGELDTNLQNLSTQDDMITTTQYASRDDGNLYLVLPSHITTEGYSETSVLTVTGEKKLYYDGAATLTSVVKGLVTKLEVLTGSETLVSTFAYDNWGNQNFSFDPRTNAGELTGTTSYSEYDSATRSRLILRQDAQAYSTSYNYDSLGRLSSTVDPRGFTVTTEYDEFSRPIKTYKTGESSQDPGLQYSYSSLAAIPGWNKTTTKVTASSSLESLVYRDALGRQLQSKSQRANGNWLTVDTHYETVGLVSATSNPYVTGSSSYSRPASPDTQNNKYTTTEYEDILRPYKTIGPDSGTSYLIYGKTYVSTVDPLGYLKCTQSLSNVSYNYTYGDLNFAGKTYAQMQAEFNINAYATRVRTTAYANKTRIAERSQANPTENIITSTYDQAGRKTGVIDGDAGTWSYSYDKNGNLKTQSDAKGQTISYEYDNLNRLTQKKDSSGTTLASYLYGTTGNDKQRLVQSSTPQITASYSYNLEGQPLAISKTITGYGTQTENYSYTPQGRLATQTYPNGEVVTHNYNTNGEELSVIGTSIYAHNQLWDEMGRPTSVSYGNAVVSNWEYDPVTLALVKVNAGTNLSPQQTGVTGNVMSLHYGYQAKTLRLTTKIDQQNATYSETYNYYSTGKLLSASGVYGTRTYLYDDYGNLLGQNGTQTNTYNAPGQARPHAITSDGTNSYTYDANGSRITKGANLSYLYDQENRLIEVKDSGVTIQTNSYGESSQRVKKTEGSKTIVYWFDDYEWEYENSTLMKITQYYKAQGQTIAQRVTQGSSQTITWLHKDQLGSASKQTDTQGTITSHTVYEPYGKLAYQSGTDLTKFAFTGYEKDTATNLDYANARMYDPNTGSFTQSDKAKTDLMKNITLSLPEYVNGFAYCMGDPVNSSDPTGYVAGNPNMPKSTTTPEQTHETLSWLGMIPVLGTPFALLNAAQYAVEGNATGAALALGETVLNVIGTGLVKAGVKAAEKALGKEAVKEGAEVATGKAAANTGKEAAEGTAKTAKESPGLLKKAMDYKENSKIEKIARDQGLEPGDVYSADFKKIEPLNTSRHKMEIQTDASKFPKKYQINDDKTVTIIKE